MKVFNSLAKDSVQVNLVYLVFIGILFFNSCVTNRKTTYLQEYKKSDYPIIFSPPESYLIQPNDNIFIRVSTPDPRLSSIFNTMTESGAMSIDEASSALTSYPVQLDGTIDIPYIGSVAVAGKTLIEAKKDIESELVDYVTDAAITVLLVNNYVSILGDVNRPGLYPIYKERLNIFQALAMAEDMSDFSDRHKLKIIRQTMEGSIVKEFDLTDRNIVDSEFYYVMPNDIIYASPMKGKFFRMNTFPFTLVFTSITTAISVFILIQNYVLLQQTR